ncbi:MAG: hypothetical protein ACD_20C00087G0005 [uncultured bacterium]|nr:MAG: hypothetical protein ACD_20C00087G0005 [uncultured bacterium]
MQKIKNWIQRLLKSSTVKDLSILFFESIMTRGLNFIIILILTRLLGPSDYGKYSFIFVSMAFCSAIFDFGMENTAVRFSNKEKQEKNSIFGLYFLVKSIILTTAIFTLILFGENIFIALNKGDIIEYIPYLIIGLAGESLLFVNDTYLQAMQQFKLRAVINTSRYIISLMYISILAFNNLLMLKYVFYMYLIPLGISLFFLPRYISFLTSFFKQKLRRNLLIEIFNYEKWMLNICVSGNVLSRIDFFMLSFWVNYSLLGIYNAAFQLSSFVSFLPYIFGKVMLPKVSNLKNDKIFNFTRKTIPPVLVLSFLIILFIPITGIIVPLLFGNEYIASVPILQILLLAFTIAFITVPFEQALYSLGKPKFIAAGKYLQILIIVILNIIMIPKFGILWAAINVAIGRLIMAVILIFLFIQEERAYTDKSELVYSDLIIAMREE